MRLRRRLFDLVFGRTHYAPHVKAAAWANDVGGQSRAAFGAYR